jgi:SanA protein
VSKFLVTVVTSSIIFGYLLFPVIIFANAQIAEMNEFVYDNVEDLDDQSAEVLLVLGGGINSNLTPRPLLENRLTATAELYQNGRYQHIIVSGDNRFENYNEPTVMKRYLTKMRGIREDVVQEDFAGRSTYESCERAAKIFGVKELVIVSQRSHLPRAIFLCRQFGIRAVGYAADDVPGLSKSQRLREVAANVKAFFNVYIIGEKTILGEEIRLQ